MPRCRPCPSLRVGITGARSLFPDRIPCLVSQLDAVFDCLVDRMGELAAPAIPRLRFLSPLARGADRLTARAALAHGFSLYVPIPFSQADYEKDFDTPEDLAEFLTLLAQANEGVLTLDGDRGADLNRSYEAVGRYVVDHCDLVISIWNGAPAAGQGGTGDIVEYAATRGVPVWWLSTETDRPPIWINSLTDFRDPPTEINFTAALDAYLGALINPPMSHKHSCHGLFDRMTHWAHESKMSPLDVYLSERPCRLHWPWRAYRAFMRWASGGIDLPWTPPRPPEDVAARYWFDRYLNADTLAGSHAARYRSTYVWVFLLGTFALIFGAAALMGAQGEALGAKLPEILGGAEGLEVLTLVATGGELLTLTTILVLVISTVRHRWHERSVEYRILAELFRKQQLLASLGGELSVVSLQAMMATSEGGTPDSGAWLSWLFSAEQRAAPFPTGTFAEERQRASMRAVLGGLIAEQRDYHSDRQRMAEAADHRLGLWGEGLFILVILCVIAKLVLAHVFHFPALSVLSGWLATVLPAVSAAFVGIRAYAELQLLAEQSRHMAAMLSEAQRCVEKLNPYRPLASLDICAEAMAVATLMLQDLDGWARLFRVKSVEPG